MNDYTLLQGDVLDQLATLPPASVHCVVTSPPYWGLRDYGVDGQIGLEPTPAAYVARLVEVFGAVWRVLRNDGTLWLNLGDSYASDTKWGGHSTGIHGYIPGISGNRQRTQTGLKPKDLVGIPWRVAFALQDAGWYLRSDIIWAKPNPMPERVTDRPTKSHEYLFLLTKRARYFYDADAIKEGLAESNLKDKRNGTGRHTQGINYSKYYAEESPDEAKADKPSWYRQKTFVNSASGRNRRSVWTIATRAYPEAHFATFPSKLVEPCILAGTSERGCCPVCGAPWQRVIERTELTATSAKGSHFDAGKTAINGNGRTQPGERYITQAAGWQPTCHCEAAAAAIPCTVLDAFAGSGTTLAVAVGLGRHAIGIELNASYITLAEKRISQVQRPLPLRSE